MGLKTTEADRLRKTAISALTHITTLNVVTWRNILASIMEKSNCYCDKCKELSSFYAFHEFGIFPEKDTVSFRRPKKGGIRDEKG